jgi:ElaB/YqjD/DUF883 family membrane-anchored ribosome-binding protein
VADPDKQERERQQAVEQRRLAELEKIKQTIQPLVQSASSGGFGVSPEAGEALLDAIHKCRDRLNASRDKVSRIQQEAKLGTSPDAVVISRFTRQVGVDGATALLGLQEILVAAEAAVTEAMKHYRRH